jgi:hypothetical protein
VAKETTLIPTIYEERIRIGDGTTQQSFTHREAFA